MMADLDTTDLLIPFLNLEEGLNKLEILTTLAITFIT